MTEETRKDQNARRLLLIDPSIRVEVARCLATLAHYGHRPLIHAEVWRPAWLQAKKKAQGFSSVSWGFHCATLPDGKPGSLAADIVDCEKFWEADRLFWLTLGYAARANKLGWGGLWGLKANARNKLVQATKFVPSAPVLKGLSFGYDVAHVETARVSISQARAGKR
jgi:hypothetical protein